MKYYKQNLILIDFKGEQHSATLDMPVLDWMGKNHIYFPRTIHHNNKSYRLIKYSDKQDLVFYRRL